MSAVRTLTYGGVTIGATKEWSASDLGLSAVNVKGTGTTNGEKVDIAGFNQFMVSVAIDNTGGGSTGLLKLVIDQYDTADNALLTSFDLVTSINTKADNTATVCFGVGNTAKLHYTSGTPSLSANADILRVSARLRISLTVTEVCDGTSVTASVRLAASK